MRILLNFIYGTNLIVMIGFLFVLTGCNGLHIKTDGDMDVLVEKAFPILPGKDLKLEIHSADISITAWDKSEVYVKILGNKEAEEKMEFDFENDEESVEIIGEKGDSFSSWFSGISLDVEIKVPGEFNTDVHTSGGDIEISRVRGRAELNTSGGDIWAKDFSGSLEVSTSGGDIVLVGSESEIDAHTSGGDISLDYTGENRGIELNTSGGDILIRLLSDFNASATLRTSGGDVYCGLQMNNIRESSGSKIIGDVNDGGDFLIAETSGGDVDVLEK